MKTTNPDDWQIVPKNPDHPHIDGLAMLVLGKEALYGCAEMPELEDARKCYLAMLAVAPKPDADDELVSLALVADWIKRQAPLMLDSFIEQFKSPKL